MSEKNVNVWLQRFGAFDSQEEEVIDQSPAYRALLRGEAREKAAADSAAAKQHRERSLRKPVH